MSLPVQSQIVECLLKAMHRLSGPASNDEQEKIVGQLLSLPHEEVTRLHDGSRTVLGYRLAWARTQLKGVGLLEPQGDGIWVLTEKGQTVKSLTDLGERVTEELNELFDERPDVEGLDGGGADLAGQYPIDSVLIRQEARSVFEVVRRIRDDRFIMDPDFQRDFIWDLDKQSKLIESMLLRIPLPVFYLAEREDGKTIVVDGLQRLSTFSRYLADEFPLRPLELAPELKGQKFSQLAPKLRNRLEDAQLILYVIDPKVPEQAKLDIFDRVNGGVPLTRQQMRNSLYNGVATKWLKSAVNSHEFALATARSLDWRTMRDRECVNRFAAFSLLGVKAYTRADMDAFLAAALKELNRAPDEVGRLDRMFRASMSNNYAIFKAHAFRKHTSLTDRRSVINVALFDVFSVLLARVSEKEVAEHLGDIRGAFYELMRDSQFIDSISQSTNSTSKVQTRFAMAQEKLAGMLPNVRLA
jgi:hypothetical protein